MKFKEQKEDGHKKPQTHYTTMNKVLKVLSDENQGGSKLVSIDSFFFTV